MSRATNQQPTATPDFTITVPSAAVTAQQGTDASTRSRSRASTASMAAGPVSGVQLSVSGLPAGVTASFTPLSAGIWSLRLDAAPTAQKFASATVTITDKLGTVTHTASVFITLM